MTKNAARTCRHRTLARAWICALIVVFCARDALSIGFGAQTASIRTAGKAKGASQWNLYCLGIVGEYIQIPAANEYSISVWANGEPAGGVWPRMALVVDGIPGEEVTVDSPSEKQYTFKLRLSPFVHVIGVTFLNDAIIGKEDSNLILSRFDVAAPAQTEQPAVAGKSRWESDMREREDWVLQATDRRIKEVRTRELNVVIRDAAGAPIPNAPVTLTQRTHDFLFGCNIGMFDHFDYGVPTSTRNAQYLDEFKRAFNYATVGFWWHSFEPVEGQPNYEYTDKVLAWCAKNGITPKGHPLLWNFSGGIPPWSKTLPPTDRQLKRVEDILKRYSVQIKTWDVVNEPFHCPGIPLPAPYALVRSLEPNAISTINEYGILADGCPGVFNTLSAAVQAGVDFDVIGIQAHEPQNMAFPMDTVWSVLDKYATLGKSIHITEFCPCSNNRRVLGATWRGTWTEDQQADYAEAFYRTCFAHPSVNAISWFDLCDIGAWRDGAGLIRRDMTPKPAYDRILNLIQKEWTTQVRGNTDAQGHFSFRGFLGGYDISVDYKNKKLAGTLALGRTGAGSADVQVK